MSSARRLRPAEIVLIVVDVVLIGLIVFLLATAPDGPDQTDGSATPSATVSQDASGASAEQESPDEPEQASSSAVVEIPDDARDVEAFLSPSGNIWCEITAAAATCQIESFDYTPPTGCDGDDLFGSIVTVTAERAEYQCPPVAVSTSDAAELAYGESTAVGDFLCVSAEQGVTCTHIWTGNAFSIARAGPQFT